MNNHDLDLRAEARAGGYAMWIYTDPETGANHGCVVKIDDIDDDGNVSGPVVAEWSAP